MCASFTVAVSLETWSLVFKGTGGGVRLRAVGRASFRRGLRERPRRRGERDREREELRDREDPEEELPE